MGEVPGFAQRFVVQELLPAIPSSCGFCLFLDPDLVLFQHFNGACWCHVHGLDAVKSYHTEYAADYCVKDGYDEPTKEPSQWSGFKETSNECYQGERCGQPRGQKKHGCSYSNGNNCFPTLDFLRDFALENGQPGLNKVLELFLGFSQHGAY